MAYSLTQSERQLLETSDEDIEQSTRVFSFEFARLEPRVKLSDRWQAAIQAHLYLDHILTQMLLEALVSPEAINLKRMSFVQKLDLVEAMGLLSTELIAPVRVLNGMRNNIAHELDGEILDRHVLDLANAMPKSTRDAIHGTPTPPSQLAFGDLLYFLVVQVDILRQRGAYQRLVGKKSEYRLRDVLNKHVVKSDH